MLDEERGVFRGGARLPYGCAAALLSDLVQLGRASVTESAVSVIDASRTGHALLDEHLAEIGAGAERTPESWLARWARPALVDRAVERLLVQGLLKVHSDRFFGPFHVRRYRIIAPRLRVTIRAHVRGAVTDGAQAVPAELAATAAILSVLGEDRMLGSRGSYAEAASRARTLARTHAVATALERALARRGQPDDVAGTPAHLAL